MCPPCETHLSPTVSLQTNRSHQPGWREPQCHICRLHNWENRCGRFSNRNPQLELIKAILSMKSLAGWSQQATEVSSFSPAQHHRMHFPFLSTTFLVAAAGKSRERHPVTSWRRCYYCTCAIGGTEHRAAVSDGNLLSLVMCPGTGDKPM